MIRVFKGDIALFIYGLLSAVVFGSVFRILSRLRLNLYLVSDDSNPENRSIISVTAELKKTSLLKTIFLKKWQEDVVLTLMDNKGAPCNCEIKYHLWGGFCLTVEEAKTVVKLNEVTLKIDRRYFLRNEMVLTVGSRKFTIAITASSPHQLMLNSLSVDRC